MIRTIVGLDQLKRAVDAYHCCCVAADRSTIVVTAAGVKRIQRSGMLLSGMLLHAADHRRLPGSSVSLVLFRSCCNQSCRLFKLLSSIADTDPPVVERDDAVPLLLLLLLVLL